MDLLEDQYSTITLLPQKADGILKNRKQKFDILNLFSKLLGLATESLNEFNRKKFHRFDAQVGENLCQIRAYKILLLGSDRLFFDHEIPLYLKQLSLLQKHINDVIDVFEASINCSQYNKLLDKKESLENFFEKQKIFLSLSEDVVFIILSFFLCKFSTTIDEMPVAVNFCEIANELNIAKYSAKRVTLNYQNLISELGCKFIFHLATELNFCKIKKNILNDLLQLSDESRFVLPCYVVTAIILEHMMKKNIDIMAIVSSSNSTIGANKVLVFVLSWDVEKNTFVFNQNFMTQKYSSPIMVIRGQSSRLSEDPQQQSNFIKKFLSTEFFTMILANTAMHPQYSGKKLYSLRSNPFEIIHSGTDSFQVTEIAEPLSKQMESHLLTSKEFAIKEGCCKENPSLFFLKHIYCDSYDHCKRRYLNSDNLLFIDTKITFQNYHQLLSL